MKLIINIPEMYYKFCIDCLFNRSNTVDQMYIANGTPYEEKPQGDWIPIKTRPLTEEEKEEYPDYSFMYDCQMPEDGQQILISTKYGVEFDTCFADDGYYLDSDRDWEDVYAWQPLPKPYKEEDNE